jgi:hypothetical protein
MRYDMWTPVAPVPGEIMCTVKYKHTRTTHGINLETQKRWVCTFCRNFRLLDDDGARATETGIATCHMSQLEDARTQNMRKWHGSRRVEKAAQAQYKRHWEINCALLIHVHDTGANLYPRQFGCDKRY